jgi:hypothetical protein
MVRARVQGGRRACIAAFFTLSPSSSVITPLLLPSR